MTAPRTIPTDLSGASQQEILELAHAHQVRFLRLQFTDILGINKNVEVPASQFQKALAGDILFDGSSIEGFVRVEESDMLLQPDLSTFRIFPWGDPHSKVARVICDVTSPEGVSFPGDPRQVVTATAPIQAQAYQAKRVSGQFSRWISTRSPARTPRLARPPAMRPTR